MRKSRSKLLLAALGLSLLPSPLWAAAGDGQLPRLLLVIAGMLAGAKFLGDLAERIGQPAVLGELLAGVLLGPSLLGIVPTAGPAAEHLRVFAELGVVLLLFEIGLETDLREMFRVGATSLAVAAVGVVVPFALGYAYWAYVPHAVVASSADLGTTAIFVGATLTATSVGITARVLSDLKRMDTAEARIVLGAAVIDDVIGLVILSVVSGLAAGMAVTLLGVLRTLFVAVGFLVAAVVLGRYLMPRIFDVVDRMRVRQVLVAFSVAFALALGAAAASAGSALIVGAFAAGIVLSGTNQFDNIEREVRPVVGIFAPIFFVNVGAAVDLSVLDPTRPGAGSVLVIALVLTVLAVVGKMVAGWAAPWQRYHRLAVGVGMVPRGEVGLIFADIGRRAGILGEEIFGAILVMVMATTFLAPVGLKAVFGRRPEPNAP
ncbi:MAG TPA: cation:proton antiporter [Gemmatimonadales bacterium]|nr:cation:proton antiporter [Gemmatimonadales bacterium]